MVPPPTPKIHRWGIVGAGKVCHDFTTAFNSYSLIGDQVIVAVAARDQSRAEAFAKTHKLRKVFATYEDMAKSSDIDIAYIGTINPTHYELCKLFLEGGKHVVCEKPLCMNYKQTESLIKFARSKNLFLMEGIWTRFSPSLDTLELDVKMGKLGDIKFLEANFGIPAADVERLSKKSLGASAILDVGVYALQLAQLFFKEDPVKVTAVADLNEEGIDVSDTIVLDYSGGRRAVFNLHTKLKLWNKATVYGTKGKATLEEPFHFADKYITVEGKDDKYPLPPSKIKYNYVNSAGFIFEATEVDRYIRRGMIEATRIPHNDSLRLAKLMDTIRKQVGVHFDEDDKKYP